jgi:hypothetical protein
MAIQKRNDEMVNLLAADFQKRYEMQFSWGQACSMFQLLSGLRGFWPMSAFDSSGNAQDQSGHGHHLTYNGNPVYGQNLDTLRTLAPHIRFDGTGDYLSRTDEADLDITGTSTLELSQASSVGAARGITLGGWWRPEDTGNAQCLIDKWGPGAGNFSYSLTLNGNVVNDPVRFYISDDGTNYDSVSTTSGYTGLAWQFIAGRFNDADAGAELAIFLNAEKTTAVTARASIFSGNADLGVGGRPAGPAYLYTGRATLVFLCAAALPDVTVWTLYQQTRALFNV